MRIVGGRWRGRALAPVGRGDAANALRPTTDRVRESLFNLLSHGGYRRLDGARVLDLFAGTGALGLEALSRGAAHATFVENGRVAHGIIAKNIDIFQCSKECTVLRRDARRLAGTPGTGHDVVFADPPYGRGLGAAGIAAARAGGWLAPDALVVLEEAAEIAVDGVAWADVRRYGDTVIHIGTLGN